MVYGNLKMHVVGDILLRYQALFQHESVGLFMPYPYLDRARILFQDRNIIVGAQSVSGKAKGAFTSQVSCDILADIGVDCVLIGHSEVRSIDAYTKEQLLLAYQKGFKIIYCIGEDKNAYESSQRESVLVGQLDDLPGIENVTIAYEPVWSIGTGIVASHNDINSAVSLIRSRVRESFPGVGDGISVLYGGSINHNNCLKVFEATNVDGFLIGGTSLEPEKILEVVKLCK